MATPRALRIVIIVQAMDNVMKGCKLKENSQAVPCFAIAVTSWWRDGGYMYKFMRHTRTRLLRSAMLWYKTKPLEGGSRMVKGGFGAVDL